MIAPNATRCNSNCARTSVTFFANPIIAPTLNAAAILDCRLPMILDVF